MNMLDDAMKDIQARLLDIECGMKDKGMGRPHAELSIESDSVYVDLKRLRPGASSYDHEYEWIRGETVSDAIDRAEQWVINQPSKEECAMRDYLAILARAIDFAKQNNLDEPMINPLAALAEKISKNVLTDQRENKGDDDDIEF